MSEHRPAVGCVLWDLVDSAHGYAEFAGLGPRDRLKFRLSHRVRTVFDQ